MPISSTAHMHLVPAVLDWQDPGSAFSAAMQLAALAAVVSYFRGDTRDLTVNSVAAAARGHFRDRYFRFSLWIVGNRPDRTRRPAELLNTCNSPICSVAVIGWACIIMALLLAVAEITAHHLRRIEDVSFRDAMLVGLAQVGALVPGVSRSGLDIDRGAHARFRARRGRAFLISARTASNRLSRFERAVGASSYTSRLACVVCSARRYGAASILGSFVQFGG